MKNQLPDNVVAYSETQVFTQDTLPEKITKLHSTKEGVWARIIVLEGALDYIIPGPPERVQRLSPDVDGVIRPAESHRVANAGPVRFKLEFYRAPTP